MTDLEQQLRNEIDKLDGYVKEIRRLKEQLAHEKESHAATTRTWESRERHCGLLATDLKQANDNLRVQQSITADQAGTIDGLTEHLKQANDEAKRLESQCAAMREFIAKEFSCLTVYPPSFQEKVESLLSTAAGQDLLSQLERYKKALHVATPIITQVSKACCDVMEWDEIDGDRVNVALSTCSEALKGQP